MDSLQANWLTEGWIDFEYKKYILLGYLKRVREAFGRVELYPMLSDLIFHYRNLVTLRDNKTLIGASFPQELTPESVKNLELAYRKIVTDDAVMTEIESIISYALPQIKASVEEGTSIYEHIESQCELMPVGLVPLYTDSGYLFISQPPARDTLIYEYRVTVFEPESGPYRAIHTQYVSTETRSLFNSYETMKLRLIKSNSRLPNPGVFAIESKVTVPYEATLVPIAKRLLIKHVSKAA